MKKTMKVIAGIVVVLAMQVAYAQTDAYSLKNLRLRFEQAKASVEAASLVAYTNALQGVTLRLKQEGNLNAYMVVDAEIKRFAVEQTVEPGLTNASSLVSDTAKVDIDSRNSKVAFTYKQYITQLEAMLKQLMMADKIAEAKQVQDELDKARFELADLSTKMPKPTGLATNMGKITVNSGTPQNAKAFQGHRYLLVMENKTWHEAKKACEDMGGHLVTIASKAEDDFVKKLVEGKTLWIGCTDEKKEGDWRWIDGTKITYKGWGAGQPDNFGSGQDYGVFVGGKQEWDDFAAIDTTPCYVCEWDR